MVSCPATTSWKMRGEQLLPRELALAAGAHEVARPGRRSGPSHWRSTSAVEVADDRRPRRPPPLPAARRRSTARGGSSNQRREPALVVRFDAEQLAEHGERHRAGEAGDQVDRPVLRAPPGRRGGRPRSARIRGSSASSRARRERPGGEPAQPGVVGRVDAEHVPGERRVRAAPRRRRRRRAASAACMSLDRSGWFSASRAAAYPTHEEGAVAVGQRHVVHRAPAAAPRAKSGNGSSRS